MSQYMKGSSKITEGIVTKSKYIRGAPSDHRGGGWAVFLCRIFFGSFGAARFFLLANASIFLSGRSFSFFFLATLPCIPPSPEI